MSKCYASLMTYFFIFVFTPHILTYSFNPSLILPKSQTVNHYFSFALKPLNLALPRVQPVPIMAQCSRLVSIKLLLKPSVEGHARASKETVKYEN